MEWGVLFFADLMAWLDSLFRRRLSSIIPDYEGLIDDPVNYLASHDVRIGPGNRYASGVVLGTILGLFLSCGLGWGWIGNGEPIQKLQPSTRYLVIAIAIFGPLATIAAILFWLRGGHLILHKDGVDFQFRTRVVQCPWRLFSADGTPAWLDRFTLVVPVERDAIRGVSLVVNGEETATGRNVETKQFRFRAQARQRITNQDDLPEVSLRDLYRGKLREIGELLLEIGYKISRQAPNEILEH